MCVSLSEPFTLVIYPVGEENRKIAIMQHILDKVVSHRPFFVFVVVIYSFFFFIVIIILSRGFSEICV